jgi:hypothetical protein
MTDATVLTPLPDGYRSHTGLRNRPAYVPVKNTPGKLLMIHKSRLGIDPLYQRKINDRLVGRIMGNWSWVSCGTLEVSQRPGDHERYFVIDGQHRWKASTYLPQVEELPCLCFELDTRKDEAIGFLATNTERRLPTLSDQFKALLVTEDQAAVRLYELADKYSRTISAPSSATTVSCVSDCMRLMRENAAAFSRIFPLACQLSTGRPLIGRILRGLHYVETHMPRGKGLQDERWRKRVLHIGYDAVVMAIKRACLYENGGHDRICAIGVVNAVNHGLRGTLLELRSGNGRPKHQPRV